MFATRQLEELVYRKLQYSRVHCSAGIEMEASVDLKMCIHSRRPAIQIQRPNDQLQEWVQLDKYHVTAAPCMQMDKPIQEQLSRPPIGMG